VTEQLALLPGYLTAHLQLTVLALLFSAIISLPLGIAASRWPRLEPPVLGVAGTIQTVPGLALLAVMVPVLAALDLQSIGFLPAIAGLTLYGVFPILRNTVTGLTGVDPALKEAAQAVGMTRGQQLVRVELPLAMPVIVAGLRTATVWLVGMTTLSTPIGATSLGNYIFSGTRPIVIGSKTFTEQYILSAVLAQWIEQRTDLPTALMQSLGSTVAFDALDAGEIDLYVDYSGTLWANEMGRASQTASRQDVLGALEQYLRLEHDITLVATLGFENAYALAIRNEDAERLNLQRISDLVAHAPAMNIGGDYEFFARPEWTALQEAYRLSFAEHRTMDSTFMYQAVAQHNVDVISAFTSDGRVAAYELTLLEDDLDAIPPYDAVVLASSDLVRRHPDIIRAVAQLDGAIGVEEMRTMNLAVDESSAHPSTVAEDFVRTLNQEK
jgi:osmoprotectant transport system permease protein